MPDRKPKTQRKPKPKLAAPAPRPARGFSSERAQRWVLIAAILTAVIYGFRRIVEPTTGTGQPAPNTIAKLAGIGAPPTVAQWAVSFSVAFLMLSALAMAAPEAAATLAGVMVVSNLLANGGQIARDITGVEGGKPPTAAASSAPAAPASTSTRPAATVSTPGTPSAPNMFQDPFAGFPKVSDPFTKP